MVALRVKGREDYSNFIVNNYPSPAMPHPFPQFPALVLLHLLSPNNNQPCGLFLFPLHCWQTNFILLPICINQGQNRPGIDYRNIWQRVLLDFANYTLVCNLYINTPWWKRYNLRFWNWCGFFNLVDYRFAFFKCV